MFGLICIFSLSRESLTVLIVVALACIPQVLHALHVKNVTVKSLTYNIYTPLEFYLLYTIFCRHVEHKKNLLLIKATAVIYGIAAIFFLLYFNVASSFIAEWAALNNILYTGWILLIIFEQYAYGNKKALSFKDPFLWYITGLLFYAPCTAMIFSMWDYMMQSNQSSFEIIHQVFNINMYVCFATGFIKEFTLQKQLA